LFIFPKWEITTFQEKVNSFPVFVGFPTCEIIIERKYIMNGDLESEVERLRGKWGKIDELGGED